MIVIEKPWVYEDGDFAYLKAKITISSDTVARWIASEKVLPKTHWRFYEDYPPASWDAEDGGMWFSVDKKYKESLCSDRGDAFVVAMLYYAMICESDIVCNVPVSEKLLVQIQHFLIPALMKGKRQIKIIAEPIATAVPNKGMIATGMSCGVDSLYTLKKYSGREIPEALRLTGLTYFNMGAIFHPNTATNERYGIRAFYDATDAMSIEKKENAEEVAKEAGLPLIYISSNLDKDYYRGAYGYTGVYRNCAMVLAAQGLFGKYYCSSAGWPDFFDLSLTEGSEHYEALLCTTFSNGTVEFILSDYATRFEKTEALSQDIIAQNYLDVCFNFNQCGTCSKCYRTLITLDLLNKVDAFAKVFDVVYFKKHREEAYAWLLEAKDGDPLDDGTIFAKDLHNRAKKQGVIPKKSHWIYAKKRYKKRLRKIYGKARQTAGKLKRLLQGVK